MLHYVSAIDIKDLDISEDDLEKRGSMVNLNGALTEGVYYILLSLLTPMHGYGIMQHVEMLSGGRVKLAAGTLYGAMNTMLERDWIQALPGAADKRKKEYMITDMGKEVLSQELNRLEELVANGKTLLGGRAT